MNESINQSINESINQSTTTRNKKDVFFYLFFISSSVCLSFPFQLLSLSFFLSFSLFLVSGVEEEEEEARSDRRRRCRARCER